jgi:hypothetical protein
VEQTVRQKNYNLGNTRHRNKTHQKQERSCSCFSQQVGALHVQTEQNYVQDIHLIHKMFTEIRDETRCNFFCIIVPKFHVIAKVIITSLLILYYEKSFSQLTRNMNQKYVSESGRKDKKMFRVLGLGKNDS